MTVRLTLFKALVSTSVLFTFLSSVSASEISPDDFRISTMGPDGNGNFDGSQPAVAYNSTNNEFFVVWLADDNTAPLVDGEVEIFGQRVSAVDGSLLGSRVRISQMGPDGDTSYGAVLPSVSYNSTANEYLVVWSGDTNTGGLVDDEFEIYGQRINAATGTEVGTNDFRISDMGPDGDVNFDAFAPAVSYDPTNDRYLVVWGGDDNTGSLVDNEFEVYGQFLSGAAAAATGTNDFRISDVGTDGDATRGIGVGRVGVAYDATNDQFLIVWNADDPAAGLADNESEIFGQLLTAAGAETGTNDFRISDMGADGDLNFDGFVAALTYNSTADEFLVVWYGDNNTGALVDNEYEIWGQRITAATGAEVGTNDFRISQMGPDGNATYIAFDPRVAYDAISNRYLVTWEADDNSGALVDEEIEVYGQLLSGTDGSETGTDDARLTAFGPDGDANYDATSAAVAANTSRTDFLVVMSADDNSGALADDELEIYGQLFGASADITLSTQDVEDPSPKNGPATYVHVIENSGPDTSYQLVLTDTLPAGATYLGAQGPSWSCSESGGVVTCNRSSLAANAQTFVIVDFTTPDSAGPLTDDTELTSSTFDANLANNVTAETTALEIDTDSDGIPDSLDTDDDGDGRTDTQEATDGTDPLDADSDDDGVSDGQEATDGSNPLDAGSAIPTLASGFCSEWNGFLGLYNINEYVNLSMSTKSVDAILYDITGDPNSINRVSVLSGAQTDVLVHDMLGFTANSYGKVCTTINNGVAGDIDGRMVYYKPNAANSYDFAFALPFQNGLKGSQFVSFNTFQPSLDAADSANLVTNWIQLTNLEDSQQTGTLYFYSQSGSTLGTQAVTLASGARQDFSGHQFGASLVGMAEWRPTSSSAAFLMRNVRYYYDNAGNTESFDSAFQLEGVKGTGELISVPLNTSGQTAVLEVLNTTNAAITATVNFYHTDGSVADTRMVDLAAYGSEHLIADSILSSELGLATVDGPAASMVAVGMHYGRNASLGIDFVYGILAKQALGTVMRGSYNTFLGQDCALWIGNPTGAMHTVTVNMTRYDGTAVLTNHDIDVPANGAQSYDLCANEAADNYGVVTVQSDTTNTIVATVVRQGASDAYRFPTPVRE